MYQNSCSNLLKAHHGESFRHCKRVAVFCHFIGKSILLEPTELQELKIAALLHDLGKINIPLDILDKPAALTSDEWAIITSHPEEGYAFLKALGQVPGSICDGVLSHHERFDGSGYPHGLKGENIPLYGRIIALADAWDAMTFTRPYRGLYTVSESVDEIFKNVGTQFDEYIVRRAIARQSSILINSPLAVSFS